MDYSEEFGDLVKEYDINLAVRVYLRGNVCHKVIECFSELGQFEKIILYAKKVNYDLDYMLQLRQIIRLQPEKSSNFAALIISEALNNGESPLVDDVSKFSVCNYFDTKSVAVFINDIMFFR